MLGIYYVSVNIFYEREIYSFGKKLKIKKEDARKSSMISNYHIENKLLLFGNFNKLIKTTSSMKDVKVGILRKS